MAFSTETTHSFRVELRYHPNDEEPAVINYVESVPRAIIAIFAGFTSQLHFATCYQLTPEPRFGTQLVLHLEDLFYALVLNEPPQVVAAVFDGIKENLLNDAS